VRLASGPPTALSYAGMPRARWWEFEDAAVNFGDVTAATDDLARLLVVEYAAVYGNDWFLWPLVLPVGAIHTIKLKVVTTFDEDVDVPATASADCQLFRPTAVDGVKRTAHDGLLLLGTPAAPIHGPEREDVLLLRDEQANLAWAVETTVTGADGRPLDRHTTAVSDDTALAPAALAPPSADDTAPLRYRLQSPVPVHWFPLVPEPTGAPVFQRLDRAVPPLGRLLAPQGMTLRQEEVPREGAQVRRRSYLARAGDGSLHMWSGRRQLTGRGEGSSGLRFDDATPAG
jgi:hypothetical protein